MSKSYISTNLRRLVAEDSRYRCGYCLTPQLYTGIKLVPDHIIPEAIGGMTVRGNLWMACRRCNEHKYTRIEAVDPLTEKRVRLFNPRLQMWSFHFVWSDGATEIIGITSTGRATVRALNMNSPTIVQARGYWVTAGWHPPTD